MTTLEILWILGTIFCIWLTYKLAVEIPDSGVFILPAIFSAVSLILLMIHFIDILTTPLW